MSDQDIVPYKQSTLEPTTLRATPPEFERHKQTHDKEKKGDSQPQHANEPSKTTGHVIPEREIIKDNSSEVEHNDGGDPRNRNTKSPSYRQPTAIVPPREEGDDDSDSCGYLNWDPNPGPDPDPRGRNGDSSDDDYKEDPVDLWALRQRQMGRKDPQFMSSSVAERRSMMYSIPRPPEGDYLGSVETKKERSNRDKNTETSRSTE